MSTLPKLLIGLGCIFIVSGVVLALIGKIPGIGRLPGDILIKRENFSFYFPLTTCLILSLVFSFCLYFWNR